MPATTAISDVQRETVQPPQDQDDALTVAEDQRICDHITDMYRRRKAEFEARFPGQHVAVSIAGIAGPFENPMDAVREGYRRFRGEFRRIQIGADVCEPR